jgi:hypothetical protein
MAARNFKIEQAAKTKLLLEEERERQLRVEALAREIATLWPPNDNKPVYILIINDVTQKYLSLRLFKNIHTRVYINIRVYIHI